MAQIKAETLTPELVRAQLGLQKMSEIVAEIGSNPDNVEIASFVKAMAKADSFLQNAAASTQTMMKIVTPKEALISAAVMWAYFGYCLARAQAMEPDSPSSLN